MLGIPQVIWNEMAEMPVNHSKLLHRIMIEKDEIKAESMEREMEKKLAAMAKQMCPIGINPTYLAGVMMKALVYFLEREAIELFLDGDSYRIFEGKDFRRSLLFVVDRLEDYFDRVSIDSKDAWYAQDILEEFINQYEENYEEETEEENSKNRDYEEKCSEVEENIGSADGISTELQS